MDDPAAALIHTLDTLKSVARKLTTDEAVEVLDAATLQVFWREWPAASGWAGSLWRRLNDDLDQPSSSPQGDDMTELGGSG